MRNPLLLVVLLCASMFATGAEPRFERGAVLVRNELRVAATGIRAMAVAAHLDDEDGATLAYLRELGAETHICFSTRGEGGQNEAGPELGLELAAIRTREIEEACEILGAKAWYLNRPDFGFSKSVEETLQVWNHDEALERLVHVIRKVRPQIVITNHNPDGTDHGHHRTTGKLLVEAFDAAADPKQFPKQISEEKLEAWGISRIYLRHFAPPAATFTVDVSKRDELTGLSASEIGAIALARHSSQGMMRSLKTGERELRFFSVLKARRAADERPASLLDGLVGNQKFNDVPDAKIFQQFSEKPTEQFRVHATRAVAEYFGIKLEAALSDAFICAGEKTTATLRVANTGTGAVALKKVSFSTVSPKWVVKETATEKSLPTGAAESIPIEISAEEGTPIDQPANEFLFSQETQTASVTASATFEIQYKFNSFPLTLDVPIPIHCAPKFSFALSPASVLVFGEPNAANDTDEVVSLRVLANCNAQLKEPAFLAAKAGPKPKPGEEGLIRVLGGKGAHVVWNLRQFVSVEQLNKGAVQVPVHVWDSKEFFTVPNITVQRVAVDLPANMRVGLVKGVDDQTYHALKLMQDAGVGRGTFAVELLSDEDLRAADLNRYQAILLDIRSTQQRPVVREVKDRLKDFMNNGGTVVCFYQKDFDWNEHGKGLAERGVGIFRGVGGGGEIAPYPIEVSFERVTREDAEVRILNPDHLLMRRPCSIWPKDFAGWVQERGAYFPNKWAAEYTPILSCNDPGEKVLDGGLLVADVGQGAFIYTSYFLHRQLKANVPGAYRLLINMMSYSRMKR